MMSLLHKVKHHIETFDEDLCENGIGVSCRSYIATATLLTYCSALRFHFQGRLLPRGWLDILIIGDTACGKSAVTETIVNRMKLGEFIKGENTSFAGLVGGLQQVGTRAKWDIIWGRMPLNHGKLLVIDEMSSLPVEAISDMSAIRSSGIAEIVKVQAGITRSATRLVWLGNPRSDNSMAHYTFGVDAVRELIGRPEDIRRFDFAIGVMTSDVPADIVNKRRDISGYRGKWDELRQLVKWVWQLRPAEIEIDGHTTDTILQLAKDQAKDYDSSFPLVEPNEQRVKLARVATAVAARCLSERGGKLIVKPHHAAYADIFMRQCFDSKALGYKRYSDMKRAALSRDMMRVGALKAILDKVDPDGLKLPILSQSNRFTVSDLEAIYNICRQEAREMVSAMLGCGFLIRTKDAYTKTPMGVAMIEEMMR